MKIVILYGSPRKGDTYEIVDKVKSQLNVLSTDHLEFDEVFLTDYDYGFCKGCYNCFEFGEDKCPHYNQINPIIDKIKACDGLIVTSPVYVLHVTAMLKTSLTIWLIFITGLISSLKRHWRSHQQEVLV